MTCKTIQKRFIAYLDNELHDNEQKSIELHLKTCQHCYEIMNQMRQAWMLLETATDPVIPPFAYTRFQIKLKTTANQTIRNSIERILIPITLCLGLFLGGFVGRLFNKNQMRSTYTISSEDWLEPLHLDTFHDFPDASLGNAYYQFISNRLEGGRP